MGTILKSHFVIILTTSHPHIHYYSIHTHTHHTQKNTLIQMKVRKILGQYVQSNFFLNFKSWHIHITIVTYYQLVQESVLCP